ncbi:MAG: anti-sigma factor [Dehalococcoidia bacterium]
MKCQQVQNLLPAYAVSALEPPVRDAIDAHLQRCLRCAEEAQPLLEGAAHLAEGMLGEPLPSGLKGKVLEKVLGAHPTRKPQQSPPFLARPGQAIAWAAVLAIVGVVLWLGAWGLHRQTRLEQALARQQGQIQGLLQGLQGLEARQDARLGQLASVLTGMQAKEDYRTEALSRSLHDLRQLAYWSAAPDLRVVWVRGTSSAPTAYGMLLAPPEWGVAILVVIGLDPLPPAQVYQVWLVRGDKRFSGGTFTVDTAGWAQFLVQPPEPLTSFDSLTVTIEPAQGSLTPNGPLVLAANLLRR